MVRAGLERVDHICEHAYQARRSESVVPTTRVLHSERNVVAQVRDHNREIASVNLQCKLQTTVVQSAQFWRLLGLSWGFRPRISDTPHSSLPLNQDIIRVNQGALVSPMC